MKLRQLLVPLGLIISATILRLWIAPLAERLPADYASETEIVVEDHFRASPALGWETNVLTNRRVDQTLANSGELDIIQGDLHVYTDSGQIVFESAGLYAADRRTRQNLPGYGDTERTGQFLFPPHLSQTTYTYWDPLFIGPRVATFQRAEARDGLAVYVFRFAASGLDETVGYSYMPDVPERYQAHTDGQGTLWIETASGTVVDYEEQGVSYFVDPATGARLDDFHQWSGQYTPETKAAQIALARAARLRILALETVLPSALLFVGFSIAVIQLTSARRSRVRKGVGESS